MNNDGGVLPRLDHFVEITNPAGFDGARERSVDPRRAVSIEKITADQIAGGQIFVTGNSHERHSPIRRGWMRCLLRRVLDDRQGTAELPGHILDEASLACARRSFEQYRDFLAVSGFKDFYFIRVRNIKRFLADNVFFDAILLK